jgi:hypothetical protein
LMRRRQEPLKIVIKMPMKMVQHQVRRSIATTR